MRRNRHGMRHLLWVDCSAGAVVGVAVLALHRPLAALEGLPVGVLLFTGATNLVYACYSFTLALRRRRSRAALATLVAANLAWVPICVALAVVFRSRASAFGFAHLIGEACFVLGLATLEWIHRDNLTLRDGRDP